MIYQPQKRNTPIATLIKNYINKKSGKVAESRNEIQRRFEHLDWKDQKKILMASLDSCKSDRSWAYKRLLRYWDKSFEPKVKEIWDKYHEPMCAWPIIRFFPISYVKENMESFTSKRDYYFICLRLAEDANYVIDRNKLRAIICQFFFIQVEQYQLRMLTIFFLKLYTICVFQDLRFLIWRIWKTPEAFSIYVTIEA